MSSVLNIAMLHKTLPGTNGGGVVWQVHQLANALADAGHKVTVFTLATPPADARYDCRAVGEPGPRGPVNGLFVSPWRYARQCYEGFDVVHAHGDDQLLHRDRPPLVRTFYGSSLSEARHSTTVAARAFHLCGYALELVSASRADVRVAISTSVRHHVPHIDAVVPCGVDLSLFRPGPEKSARPSILFVGTLRGRKRGAWLLDLFRSTIRPRVPNAELWLVCEDQPGGSSDESEGVKTFHRIPAPDLAAMYRSAWICCLPSTYEGFGVPYVEALASGTAVVASPNSGAREILGERGTGVIAGDRELAGELIRLLEDSAARHEIAEAGRRAAACYGWDRVAGQYERVYALAMSRRRQ